MSVIYLQTVDGVCVFMCAYVSSINPGPLLQRDLVLTALLGVVGGGGPFQHPSNELLSTGGALVERLCSCGQQRSCDGG